MVCLKLHNNIVNAAKCRKICSASYVNSKARYKSVQLRRLTSFFVYLHIIRRITSLPKHDIGKMNISKP